MENIKHEILLGLTTTPASDWRGKVEEMKKFGIKKIALFPTFLNVEQRKELYMLLEELDGLEIPHVHLRAGDMEEWEMEMFEKKYKTEVYNIHAGRYVGEFLEKYKDKIYIENHFRTINEKQIEWFAGVCLDVQHFKRVLFKSLSAYRQTRYFLGKYRIGCCHISALPKIKNIFKRIAKNVGGHYMITLDELDYVADYENYMPRYMSIELENSFEEQLEAKKYLEKILNI